MVSTTLQSSIVGTALCLLLLAVSCCMSEAVTAATSSATMQHRGTIALPARWGIVPLERLRLPISEDRSCVLIRGGAIEIGDEGENETTNLDNDEYTSDEEEVEEAVVESIIDGSEDEYEDEDEEEALLENEIGFESWNEDNDLQTESALMAYDALLVQSSLHQMGLTFGIMLFCRKLDLNDPKIVKMARLAFIAYLIVVQVFLVYVRIQARTINDRTPITISNPISSLLQAGGGGATQDLVKSMASSFLNVQSSVYEYDIQQAKSMGNALLFPMVMLWFLHFKMGQVQPLFFQTATGILNFVYSPLFQAYVLKRNLERPFTSSGKPNNSNMVAKLVEKMQTQTRLASQRDDKRNVVVEPIVQPDSDSLEEEGETDGHESEASEYETSSGDEE